LRLVAQKGTQAPGFPGGINFVNFTQVALPDVNGVIILGTVTTNSSAGVTTSSNTGIWAVDGSNNLDLLVHTGEMLNGKTVTALNFLSTIAPASGQSRGFSADSGAVTFIATFSDHTTAVFDASVSSSPASIAGTGSSAPGPNGATFASFEYPASNANGHNAFRAYLTTGSSVTASNKEGIWANENSSSLSLVAQTGSGNAPGTTAPFVSLSDPVYNDSDEVAFVGTLKTGTGLATAATNLGVWTNFGGSLTLAARTGSQAPGCPAGVVFSNFTQIALPDENGVVLLGKLSLNPSLGVTAANNTGIWATDSSGNLQLIVRIGDFLNGNAVTNLTFLSSVATVSGQSRSFALNGGNLTFLATFSGGTTSVYTVTLP
jgi:dipeptidyl aminopeptidase/acylaminoacyl peptidase